MNNKNISKNGRFIIFCIVLSIVLATVATVYEHNKKQPEPVVVSETETVPASTPEPEPEKAPEPETATASEPETVSDDETEQETVVLDTGSKYPHPMFIYSGWDRCLEQLKIDCDVAFLGDSIIYKSSFDLAFPDYVICNLGISGDTIRGIKDRLGTLETVKPEKVFFMIGINSLKDDNIDECIEKYTSLVENVRSRGDFDLYLISILPVSEEVSTGLSLSPDTIVSFNRKIAELAGQNNATYFDLYSYLEESGYIKPEYTVDGLHLSEEAYGIWVDAMRPYIEGN